MTMSYQGSPYSNPYQDDYEFVDDRYKEDDERENEDGHLDDSDEDTEEASETDMGRNEEPLEIKEQYVKKLDSQRKERLRLNIISREYLEECVERDYINEKRAAAKELEEKKIELRENLLSDLEKKRNTIEAERYSMELTGDAAEVKPVMTRKLRCRPNDPMPVPE